MEELTNNKGIEEIEEMYDVLRESVRHYLSRCLMDTSEENRKEVYIPLEHGAVGLSTLEMPTIVSIWQHPSEGIICVRYEFSDEDIDLDDLSMEDIIQIARDI